MGKMNKKKKEDEGLMNRLLALGDEEAEIEAEKAVGGGRPVSLTLKEDDPTWVSEYKNGNEDYSYFVSVPYESTKELCKEHAYLAFRPLAGMNFDWARYLLDKLFSIMNYELDIPSEVLTHAVFFLPKYFLGLEYGPACHYGFHKPEELAAEGYVFYDIGQVEEGKLGLKFLMRSYVSLRDDVNFTPWRYGVLHSCHLFAEMMGWKVGWLYATPTHQHLSRFIKKNLDLFGACGTGCNIILGCISYCCKRQQNVDLPPPPDDTGFLGKTVKVGCIPPPTTVEALWEIFSKFATVKDVKILKDWDGGSVGFVTFATEEEAERLVKEANDGKEREKEKYAPVKHFVIRSLKVTAPNLAESAVHARIRERLNFEGVRLWQESFFDAPHELPKDEQIMALGSRYSTELELQEGEVIQCLYSLQRNDIERLAEREAFQSTGKATLRLSGFPADKVMQGSEPGGPSNRIQVNLKDTTGRQIKERIATILSVPSSGLKLICGGKVISENVPLELQNVRNGSQLMVLSVATATDKGSIQFWEDICRGYNLVKIMKEKQGWGICSKDEAALTVALALHEKGRSFLKLLHFSKALVFLLEADTAYNQCPSQFLDMVDNYGLLNLDVAWCYLNLQSIAELPQVEQRLWRAESTLNKKFGDSLRRLLFGIEGSSGTGWEAALYVRLHLLQGITSYHLGQIEESEFLLDRADQEMKRLKVSDESLAELVSMGYGQDESRMALRSTYGDKSTAVDFIIRQREEQAQLKAQEKEEKALRKLQTLLGDTISGVPVDVQTYRELKDLRYPPFLVAAALRQINNDRKAALILLNHSTFSQTIYSKAVATSSYSSPGGVLCSVAKKYAAVAATILGGPMPEGDLLATLTALQPDHPQVVEEAEQAVESALNRSFSDDLLSTPQQSEEDLEKGKKAYDTLKKDLRDEEDYIDLELEQETNFLEQYRGLLASL